MRKLNHFNILFKIKIRVCIHLNIFYKKKLRKYLEFNLLQMRAILRISSNIV